MVNQKKILYILTKPDLGGVQKYLLELTKGLPETITPFYIMSSEGYFSEELLKLGISEEQIFFVPMTNSIIDIKTHIKSNLETLKIIKKIKPDLIHCNSTTASIVSAITGTISGTKTIFSVHGWPFTDGISKNKQLFYKILNYFLCLMYDKITCETDYDTKQGIAVIPFIKNKTVTVHNGISDMKDEYKKQDYSKDDLKITMIARYCPQKDPYTLIQAVGELNNEGYNVKLDLYGYGQEEQKVLEEIKKYNTQNIRNCGSISDDLPIFKNYDIYSLISNWEGLPISIIEAMAAGMPILISDICGNSELIKDNGFLIPRKDVTELKQKIKLFYDNRDLLKEMGEKSRELYEKEFEANVMVEKLLSLYQEVING